MTTVDRVILSSQPYTQLNQYVMLLHLSMTQRSNHDGLEVGLKLTLEQEKQISRQGRAL